MPSPENPSLTAERARKAKALASMRELQLHELTGKLVRADQVERVWSKTMLQVRDAVLRTPVRCARRFSDPKEAARIIRSE